MATVLALDDDALNLELLAFLLHREGHSVQTTSDAQMALQILRSQPIDLLVLETELPRQDGHRVCQQIRQLYRVLPVMIVSERDEEDQIVRGLMEAADDYLTKPFSPREFLARVRALLRRARVGANSGQDDPLVPDDLNLDLRQRWVNVNGIRLHLTPRELALLHVLVMNRNRVLSRDQLIRQAWDDDIVHSTRAVDVYVLRLRKKLDSAHWQGLCIRSWRGFGYSLETLKGESHRRRLDDKIVTNPDHYEQRHARLHAV